MQATAIGNSAEGGQFPSHSFSSLFPNSDLLTRSSHLTSIPVRGQHQESGTKDQTLSRKRPRNISDQEIPKSVPKIADSKSVKVKADENTTGLACRNVHEKESNNSPIFSLSVDLMAEVLLFLDPIEILRVMTVPVCKSWRSHYGSQQDLWEILISSEPFNTPKAPHRDLSIALSSTAQNSRVPSICRYQLLYASFVKCFRYLKMIRQDATSGTKKVSSWGNTCRFVAYSELEQTDSKLSGNCNREYHLKTKDHVSQPMQKKMKFEQVGKKKDKPRIGVSMITNRLLLGSSGQNAHLNLPKSCAVFSIVNWMSEYPTVEGIQINCIQTLRYLLEDEAQRLTAQRVGLVDVILKTMLKLPDSLQLHIAAFHAMVLLGRPIGGKEGMLFDTAMSESPISGVGFMSERASTKTKSFNGVEILLNSMRHFEKSESLQSMACWSLVNLALVPEQKNMILSLRGIECTLRAMTFHPNSYDVQFRALFALINLVVVARNPVNLVLQDQEAGRMTEKDALDEVVACIASLVVRAMKNFCESAAILNRGCLILHNLSQSEEYQHILLATPHCYQMLEWCLTNYQTDAVLRKGALSAFHRLQNLLARS